MQEAIERALEVILRHRPSLTGSGRTDAGVHARGQVAHFQTDVAVDPYRLCRSLNGLLCDAIAILSIERVADDFHARYDARRRLYHYHITTQPRALERHLRWHLRPSPDVEKMNRAVKDLLGTHNYSAFCRTRSETENRVCTVQRAVWVAEERSGNWRFEIAADRFLHGMVRAIVGTLVKIGQGKWPADDLPRVLATEDRREAGPAAPAHGLVLHHVGYDLAANSGS